jgi:hypothetical protein
MAVPYQVSPIKPIEIMIFNLFLLLFSNALAFALGLVNTGQHQST